MGKRHASPEEGIEARQQGLGQQERDQRPERRIDQSLADELRDQVGPLRPGQLAHPDLDRAAA